MPAAFSTLSEYSICDLFTTVQLWVCVFIGGVIGLAVNRVRDGIFGVVGRKIRNSSVMSKTTLAAQREIQAKIDELQHQFKALRVCVMQFHNGEFFMLANHAWKITLTHESLGPGIGMLLAQSVKGLPATTLLDLVDPLFDPTSAQLPPGVSLFEVCRSEESKGCFHGQAGRRVLHYNAAQMRMTTSRALMNTHGIYHAFNVPLLDARTKNVIGTLSMQFGELFDECAHLRAGDLCIMCRAAEEIQYYLTTDHASYRKQVPLLLRWIFPEQKCN